MTIRTAQLGVARYGNRDVHHVHSHSHASTVHTARCGVFITLTDDPPALRPMCEDCLHGRPARTRTRRQPPVKVTKAAPASAERTIHDTWRICADWDARYNGSIRNLDAKPLRSIL